MRDIAILFIHLLATVLKLIRPGGTRSVVAESLLLKHQLLILNRSKQRAPNLRPIGRVIAGLCAGIIRPARLFRSAVVLKPSTLMSFHRSLVRRKYQWLFTPKTRRKPGPKAPSAELVEAIVEMNAATLDSAAGGSLSRFPLPSALRSTKTSFAGFLPNIFGAIHPAAHPG